MAENNDGVMVALLPITTDWSTLELPHLTIVYSGKVEDHKPTQLNELAKDACSLAMLSRPLTLSTMGKVVFGDGSTDNPYVDVIRMRPSPELWAMRNTLERWNQSEFPFNPHVTTGPLGGIYMDVPRYIAFNRIMVGWGNEQLIFNLSQNSY